MVNASPENLIWLEIKMLIILSRLIGLFKVFFEVQLKFFIFSISYWKSMNYQNLGTSLAPVFQAT